MPETIDSLSVWGLIEDASLVVQLVMLILVAASIVSWFLIVYRSTLIAAEKRAMKGFEISFRSANDLKSLYQQTNSTDTGMQQIFRTGFNEYLHLSHHPDTDPEAIIAGVQRAMQVAIGREEEQQEKHLPFLATVGSVSPYIGLFGTVWGIMNSFIGLSQVQQATLAAVAPGIAEALIATAVGLFAAIPAVIAYNRFAAIGESLLKRYYTFADELSTVLHRRVYIPGQR
jgi:biopolymer transport protein TolQ